MDDSTSLTIESAKAAGRALIREAALVDGEWLSEGEPFPVEDPAEEAVFGHAPRLSAQTVERAVKSASDAFPGWAATKETDRADILRRWAALIDRDTDALGALLALENGKPFPEAKGEIAYANQFIKWFAGEAERLNGDLMPSPLGHDRILTFKEPIGPVAAITPWNFPAAMITRKVGPAFAAGCTVVLKPASATPFSALALAALAMEAGLPKGVLNVVTGDNRVVGPVLTLSLIHI